jgi:hypothetical protein
MKCHGERIRMPTWKNAKDLVPLARVCVYELAVTRHASSTDSLVGNLKKCFATEHRHPHWIQTSSVDPTISRPRPSVHHLVGLI